MSSDPQGVVAFGDSITNAGGEIHLGTALQSWALWTARGMGVPYTPYAVDGAVVSDVTGQQIPLFVRVNADPHARFALGCLYIGTNDTRLPSWDPDHFSGEFDRAVRFLTERCERVLCPNIPLRMGRPAHLERTVTANAIIDSVAARHRALVLDLREFGARNTMMADHVHPTAHGQVAIAERALARLAADGVVVRVHPSELMRPLPGFIGRLQSDGYYTFRCTRERLKQTYWTWRLRG